MPGGHLRHLLCAVGLHGRHLDPFTADERRTCQAAHVCRACGTRRFGGLGCASGPLRRTAHHPCEREGDCIRCGTTLEASPEHTYRAVPWQEIPDDGRRREQAAVRWLNASDEACPMVKICDVCGDYRSCRPQHDYYGDECVLCGYEDRFSDGFGES